MSGVRSCLWHLYTQTVLLDSKSFSEIQGLSFSDSASSFIFCSCMRVRVEPISASFCISLESSAGLLSSASSCPSTSKRNLFRGLGAELISKLLFKDLSLLFTIALIFWNLSEVPNDSPIDTRILVRGVMTGDMRVGLFMGEI